MSFSSASINSSLTLFSESLRKSLEKADEEIVLVSPFVKSCFLRKFFEGYAKDAPLTLVTRFNLLDFARGVSDIEAWDEIWAHGGKVLGLNRLHAKYYRFDKNVFIGSANLTERAFSDSGNLEILKKEDFTTEFQLFEKELFSEALPLTIEFKSFLVSQIKTIQSLDKQNFPLANLGHLYPPKNKGWLPTFFSFSSPEKLVPSLWRANIMSLPKDAFSKNDLEKIKNDLVALGIEDPVLDLNAFREILKIQFLATGLTQKIDHLFSSLPSNKPYLSFGKIYHSKSFDFEDKGQVNSLMGWLEQLFPERDKPVPPQSYSRLLSINPEAISFK